MQITLEFLQGKKACGDGQRWFKKHFPGGGDINSVLVMVLTDEDAEASWVSWLMQAAGWKDLSFLNGLQIGGSLDLRGTQITALPEGLSVGGSLDLSGTQITALPEGLKSKIIR